tara:strand:+ start:7029 stop:7793 length:765 start_codon:yes stop_codon:yes gene_type:complete
MTHLVKQLMIISVCLMSTALFATITDNKYAEKAFFDQRFDQSVRYYEAQLSQFPGDSTLLYNLGTTYLHANQYGPAVFYLKQAALYSPRDLMTRENLRIAREKRPGGVSAHFAKPGLLFDKIMSSLSFREYISLLLAIACLSLGVIWGMSFRSFIPRFSYINRCLWGIVVICLCSGLYSFRLNIGTTQVVIQQSLAPVYLYPTKASSPIVYLQSGTETRLFREDKQWALIQVEDIGKLWISKKSYWKLKSGFLF